MEQLQKQAVGGEFGWLGFLVCFLYKINPNPRKNIFCEKTWPNATFDLVFLGLSWPRVGEFVGFIVIFICFPTQQNLVNRKDPNKKTI